MIEKVKFDIREGRREGEILQTLRPILDKEPEAAVRMIEELSALPSLEMARLLQQLLEVPCDKKIRKAIKRSLYRLKSKGIIVEEVSAGKEGPVFRPLQTEPPRGFGGPFDFLGRRFLVLVIPHAGKGLTVMQGIVGDTEGLVDFSGGEMTRKRFKPFFEEIQKGGPFSLIAMEPSYVGYLFAQANQLALDQGKSPLQEYIQLRKEVESIKKEYEQSPVYSMMETDEIEGDERVLNRGGDLLKTDLFGSWKIREEEIRPYANEVWEAEESKLVLNQPQKEARFQEIYQRALSDLFPEEKRSLYRRRMEDMAYYLFKSGREEEAKVSLAVAIDLKKAPNVIQP